MRIRDIILLEAQPNGLGQGMLDKLFATYSRRDINDNLLPQKFENGMQIAELIYQNIGPTYLRWVAKQYTVDQSFFLHDLGAWNDTLKQYESMCKDRRIQIERDINKFKNIVELRAAIREASGEQSSLGSKFYSSMIASIDKFVKAGEASWLYRGNDYSIYHPKTFASSNMCKKFMSTDVCTILGSDHFEEYSSYGTLMYIITQDKLYNCYISKDTLESASEFSDEKNDHKFTLEWMLENFPALKPLVKRASTPKTDFAIRILLADTPAEKEKLCLVAVKLDGLDLQFVPTELKGYELCLVAVKQNGLALQFVPRENLDEAEYKELCLVAVKQDGSAWWFVPREILDETEYKELCLVAVKSNGKAVRYIPKNLHDYELCLAAVQQNGNEVYFVSRENLTKTEYKEICLAAVQQNGLALGYVPPELRDYDICLAAVKQNGVALSYVPNELQDYDICLAALKQNTNAMRYVPKEIQMEIFPPIPTRSDDELDRVKELAERLNR